MGKPSEPITRNVTVENSDKPAPPVPRNVIFAGVAETNSMAPVTEFDTLDITVVVSFVVSTVSVVSVVSEVLVVSSTSVALSLGVIKKVYSVVEEVFSKLTSAVTTPASIVVPVINSTEALPFESVKVVPDTGSSVPMLVEKVIRRFSIA